MVKGACRSSSLAAPIEVLVQERSPPEDAMTRAWAVALASAVLSRVAADGMIRNAEAYWVRGARRPAIPPPALADPQPP